MARAAASSAPIRSTSAQAAATGARSIRPKLSSSARWPRGFNRPRSSCWPWTSMASAAASRSSDAGTLAAPAKARLPPSAFSERRRISGSPTSGAMPCSASIASAAWSSGSSISALTLAVLWPLRTSAASARLPIARPSASSRIDLPAPVSPVSTPRPGSKSIASRSISTTSWMTSCLSIRRRSRWSALRRRRRVPLDQLVAALVPFAARIIGAEHGRGLARLVGDAEREVGFDQPLERLGGV